MKTVCLRLDFEVASDVRETIAKNLYWTDRRITDVDVSEHDHPTLTITCADDTDEDVLQAQVLADVRLMASQQAGFPVRTVYRHQSSRPYSLPEQQVYSELMARNWVSPELRGSFTFTGIMADLYYGLDRLFADLAKELGARNVYLPSLLDTKTLLKSSYLDDYAHLGNYVFHLHEDRSTLALIAAAHAESEDGLDLSRLPTSAANPEAVLSPAACQPFYPLLAGSALAERVLVTGYTRCYRYESGATRGLRRSREFGVREIILVGTGPEVTAFRQELLDLCRDLLERLDVGGELATASDPFFIDTAARYRMFQMSFDVKHEVRLDIHRGPAIAVASVNLHSDHFGKAWDIRQADGSAAHSCCMGFGIDRWCLAIFSQFGFAVRDWPHTLQEVVAG